MNAEAFRHLYEYHFAENRKLWQYVTQLSYEQFVHDADYSLGSVRSQVVHLMSVEEAWFAELQGILPAEPYQVAEGDDREQIRSCWDQVEQSLRAYLAKLEDDMLFTRPIQEPEEDRNLMVWQVLIHVVNHGTDHRAQILRLLHDSGIKTTSQDYIFYVYDNL
jgi:uncharacterized damage-inducible protein DinB